MSDRKTTPTGLVSLIPRIERSKRDALRELSKRTRVTYSELWRMAIEDVLRKYVEVVT